MPSKWPPTPAAAWAARGSWGPSSTRVSGASFMMTTYTAQGGAGSIAFASKFPGHILPIDVAPGNEFMVHRHGFMAATPGIELSMGFQQSFRGGIFGGEGFILQKVGRGTGRAFIDLSGEVIIYDLAAGQTMRVHPGHAGLFQASVTFSVQKVPGMANRYMGSDGHHFALLTEPALSGCSRCRCRSSPASSASTCPTATTTTAPRVRPPASGAPRSWVTFSGDPAQVIRLRWIRLR